MPVRLPSIDQLLEIAGSFGMTLTSEDAASFRGLMAGSIASYNRLDQLAEPKLPVKYARTPGYRPGTDENPFNAWYWKAEIKGSATGILQGKRVAVKDNIATAGLRTTAAARVFSDRIPSDDAEITMRLKSAGVVLLGKLNLDEMAFAGTGTTGCFGPAGWRRSCFRHLRIAWEKWRSFPGPAVISRSASTASFCGSASVTAASPARIVRSVIIASPISTYMK